MPYVDLCTLRPVQQCLCMPGGTGVLQSLEMNPGCPLRKLDSQLIFPEFINSCSFLLGAFGKGHHHLSLTSRLLASPHASTTSSPRASQDSDCPSTCSLTPSFVQLACSRGEHLTLPDALETLHVLSLWPQDLCVYCPCCSGTSYPCFLRSA